MMRYVPMDGVVIGGERRFAFWDTVADQFVSIMGDESWCSVEDLVLSFDAVPSGDLAWRYPVAELRERLVGLARGNRALEETPPDES